MSKQHTVKQHYVPRFLLKQFSSDENHVFVLNRMLNKTYRTSADSICYENDVYDEKWKDVIEELGKYVLDNQIEEYFADLESKTSPLVKHIIVLIESGTHNVKLSKEEHDIISEFIKVIDADIYVNTHTTSPFAKPETFDK